MEWILISVFGFRYWITVTQLNIWKIFLVYTTAQKMKFPIKYFFSKCDKIHRELRIWSHLLKISLMENSIFCAVHLLAFMVFIRFGEVFAEVVTKGVW